LQKSNGIEASNEEATHALLVKDFHCLKKLLLALMSCKTFGVMEK
jgi:hypothetical protein